jgi:hypothetical protein
VNLKNFYPALALLAAALFFVYDISADLAADEDNLLHVSIE